MTQPLKILNGEIEVFQTGDTIPVTAGGTGAETASQARTNLGVAIGTDVQAFNANLNAIAAITGTGYLTRTGTNTYAVRDITGTAGRITATNPQGVAGNTVFDLATVANAGGGTFSKLTVDGFGRVTGTSAVVAGDITALVDSVYVNISGDTMTGPLTLFGAPTNSLHATTKQYVDDLFSSGGIAPFDAARLKTTANHTLSGLAAIDGVTPVVGDRILVANQTNPAQNGVYVASATGWTRATDANDSAEFVPARQIFVQEGTQFSNTGWGVSSAVNPTVGTDPITFTQVSGAASYTAGNGLQLTGNQFSVVPQSGQIVVTGSGVGLATSGVAAGTYTKVTVDTFGRVTVGAAATPADIGAQAAHAFLTSLTTAGDGIIVKNGTNTLSRSIAGTAGNIAVTNGNGVGGNPTVNLIATGVVAGTYNNVTVDAFGRVTSASNSIEGSAVVTMTNGMGSSIAIGRAVYVSGDETVSLAVANSGTTKNVVGMVFDGSINAAASGLIATSGAVTATTAQWDAVTGQSGGLTPGAKYYLSNVTAGAITTTAPATGYVCPLGIATSDTTFILNILTTVKL